MRPSFACLLAGLALPHGLMAAPNPLEPGYLPDAMAGSSLDVRAASQVATQSDLDKFIYFVQFAGAAYCNADPSLVGRKVACSNNGCPALEAGNVVVYAYLDTSDSANMDGAVFIDHTGKNIVVAFMGTKSVQSYLLDLDFSTSDYDELCSGCKVSYGLNSIWLGTRGNIVATVATARATFAGYSVVVVGHSAGGAVVTIAGAYLRKVGIPTDIITFGSPRIGNDAFATFVTNQAPSMGSNYRVTHYNDPVPALPPTTWGFAHVSPEYWLSRKDASTNDYPVSEIKICTGIKPSGCRASMGVTLDKSAHSYYLQQVSACYSS